MDDRHGPAARIDQPALVRAGAQVPLHRAQQHGDHPFAQVMAPRQQVAQPMREAEHPLPHRHVREYVIHEVGRPFGPSAEAPARLAEALLREGGAAT